MGAQIAAAGTECYVNGRIDAFWREVDGTA